MHSYIFMLLSALSLSPSSSRETYVTSFSSPLLDLTHLDRLAKATHNFLTPGQTKDTTLGVLRVLEDTWDTFWETQQKFAVDGGPGPRKKRRIGLEKTATRTEAGDCEASAVRFALTARLSSTVLPSLPLQSLPGSTRQEVQQIIADSYTSFIRPRLKQLFEVVGRNSRDPMPELWASQVAAVALLRLEYNLATAQQLKLQVERDDREDEQMLGIVRDGGLLPEFCLEIVCKFLFA